MIEVDFGDAAGGRRSFKTPEDLKQYVQAQRTAWSEHPLIKGRNNKPGDRQLREIPQAWGNLASAIDSYLAQPGAKEERLGAQVEGNAHLPKAFTTKSEIGQVIASIADDLGHEQAAGALRFHNEPSNQQVFQTFGKVHIEGALAFQQRMAGLSSKSVRGARDAARKMVEDLADDVRTHRAQLEESERAHAEKLEELVKAGEAQSEAAQEWRDAVAEEVRQQREEWDRKYEDAYEQYTEKLRLESSVKLWTERARIHNTAADAWQWRSILIAIIGLVLAGGVAWGALGLAEWLFSDAFVVTEGAPLPSGLRPTWRYEVIFASAATLLYLTVFFWIMRIVVRMYMTEHHLGIDAQSRASMAQTYLALTKEDVASDQDRAIVLASLFRPVVDGIVKDDGLPAITPAAILSGLAIGKPGGTSAGGT
ncbi:hypothetical protein AEB_P0023 [Altererythrobacter sp. B11]|uniref:DUF6161 domain-containing protein n=1 Tax=Altererythrobacter sp. B11 TaxID=2060312 RepID=UPI000DC71BF0|nr:DUF6161 domain-containing protein [Altererythrobacter sp. B11]BBC70891.1 hypothetical protein AEB_P0023 [Altererythrobacter sp. B11]